MAGDTLAVGVEDAVGLGVGLADGATDGAMLADWPGTVVPPEALPPAPLDALGLPDLDLPPVSA